jgi:hypothetical protein
MSNVDEARLQRLLDKDEITAVIMRYARGADRVDPELLASVYHADAVDVHDVERTPQEFVEHALTVDRSWSYMHHIGTVIVDFESDDIAFTESYFLSFHRFDESGTPRVRLRPGRYLDRFERRAGVWRIARREVVDEWPQRMLLADNWDQSGAIDGQVFDPMGAVLGGRWPDDRVYTFRSS